MLRSLLHSSSVRSALSHHPTHQGKIFTACASQRGFFSSVSEKDINGSDHVHFRISSTPHPLNAKPAHLPSNKSNDNETDLGDHTGRQQNHIWTPKELQERMSMLYRHQPQSLSDHVMNTLMYSLYHSFNFLTGYRAQDPSVEAMQWRLIILESIAGVPGFVAAGFRHFRSLRKLQRDHGWISTLLEEAENERMHLLICLSMFNASPLTRGLVIVAQNVMTPFLMAVYAVNPKAMHRFVGYLEETACVTYVNTIKHIETPGTKLNLAWGNTPAPPMAIGYYHLPKDAKWVDSLKCMMADEANHRDVNHTFADMKSDDPNPFLEQHKENAAFAWRLHMTGQDAFHADESPKKN